MYFYRLGYPYKMAATTAENLSSIRYCAVCNDNYIHYLSSGLLFQALRLGDRILSPPSGGTYSGGSSGTSYSVSDMRQFVSQFS
jgi:hypothetical protein